MHWKKGFNPVLIADKLEKLKKIKEGKVFFESFLFDEYVTVISGMVELSDEIPSDLKLRMITTSIFSAGKRGEITPKSITKEIRKQENAYLKKPVQNFVLVTSLSVSSPRKLPTLRINGCSISFKTSLDKKYRPGREEIEYLASKWVYRERPSRYINVTAKVESRSEMEAANSALNGIDFIRGIWNLLTASPLRFSARPTKPVNKILLGPVHTVHLPSGKLATQTFWYQPNFPDGVPALPLDTELENRTFSFIKKVRRRLRKHPYRTILEDAFRKYARALDYSDLDVSFFKLWSVLEFLTNTLRESYKVTVRRAAFVFEESDFHWQLINNLKTYRNSAVHSGKESTGEIEIYLYQLKRYVEQLMLFHLWFGVRFSDFEKATAFLDSQPNIGELKKRRAALNLALKYRTGDPREKKVQK